MQRLPLPGRPPYAPELNWIELAPRVCNKALIALSETPTLSEHTSAVLELLGVTREQMQAASVALVEQMMAHKEADPFAKDYWAATTPFAKFAMLAIFGNAAVAAYLSAIRHVTYVENEEPFEIAIEKVLAETLKLQPFPMLPSEAAAEANAN